MRDITRRNPASVTSTEPDFSLRLRERLQKRLGTTNAKAAMASDCLLLDLSASMAEFIGRSTTKYHELQKLADAFQNVRRFYFNCSCDELGKDMPLPYPDGGTAMHFAFGYLKQHGIKHAVMITDGIPDDENAALFAAKGLRIDVLYVGPDPAPDLLRQLAAQTGGQYEGDIKFGDGSKQIAAKVRGLLGSGQ